MKPFRSVVKPTESSTALGELYDGRSSPKMKWCSVCPSLAQYECCTVVEGCKCGLLLCDRDMAVLEGLHDGNLQEMLLNTNDQPTKERPYGIRADCELLKQDSVLMMFLGSL